MLVYNCAATHRPALDGGHVACMGTQPVRSSQFEVDHADAIEQLESFEVVDIKLGWRHGLALVQPK